MDGEVEKDDGQPTLDELFRPNFLIILPEVELICSKLTSCRPDKDEMVLRLAQSPRTKEMLGVCEGGDY